MQQTSIFDILYEKYKITKPIRLIEFFAGYGSQALALKYLGVPFEHWKICEWAVKSIQAYKDIHFTKEHLTFNKERTKEEMVEYLYQKGISANYNEPMTKEQINRLSEEQLKTILENIAITHNLVNIQQVKGKDLNIIDTDKYKYILTYSFPCQDLSVAGKMKGMSDTTTRSGLLWEVERILDECKELGSLPQILLMENVPQVHGEGNTEDFIKWQLKLESLGYKNYWEDLIATDYGIPQTRNRCFMVSILGDYSYSFPPKQPLKLKLKDMLEDNVDEKYYLSDKMIGYVCSRMPSGNNKITTGINMGNKNTLDKAGTLTTASGNRATDNFIIENDNYDYSKEQGKIIEKMNLYEMGLKQYNRRTGVVIDTNGSSATLLARTQGDNNMILESNSNEKFFNKHLRETLEQNEKEIKNGSYIDAYNRTIRDDDLSSTITTRVNEGNDTFVATLNEEDSVYSPSEKELFTEDGNIKRYIGSDIIDKFEEGQMATTTFPNGYGHGPRTHNESISLNTIDKPSVKQNLRIRKLTPNECFRLMGVKDVDYMNCAKNQSNASLYHLAGDSIVTNVLMAIFKELL